MDVCPRISHSQPQIRNWAHDDRDSDDETVTMEEEDGDHASSRKRTRDQADHQKPQDLPEDDESAANDLEYSLKKVRISKQVPGQLRLQQDIAECMPRLTQIGVSSIRSESRSPLQARVILCSGEQFDIIAGRFYPHQCPAVLRANDGSRIALPILQQWLPVYTLGDILIQLVRHRELTLSH
jgi:hypothetical protein